MVLLKLFMDVEINFFAAMSVLGKFDSPLFAVLDKAIKALMSCFEIGLITYNLAGFTNCFIDNNGGFLDIFFANRAKGKQESDSCWVSSCDKPH